eukprot:scaffold29369_cov57-Cyclotella_meneghiniana.AAC.5
MPSTTLFHLQFTPFPSRLIVAAVHHHNNHNNPSRNHPYNPPLPQNPSATLTTDRVEPKPTFLTSNCSE